MEKEGWVEVWVEKVYLKLKRDCYYWI